LRSVTGVAHNVARLGELEIIGIITIDIILIRLRACSWAFNDRFYVEASYASQLFANQQDFPGEVAGGIKPFATAFHLILEFLVVKRRLCVNRLPVVGGKEGIHCDTDLWFHPWRWSGIIGQLWVLRCGVDLERQFQLLIARYLPVWIVCQVGRDVPDRRCGAGNWPDRDGHLIVT